MTGDNFNAGDPYYVRRRCLCGECRKGIECDDGLRVTMTAVVPACLVEELERIARERGIGRADAVANLIMEAVNGPRTPARTGNLLDALRKTVAKGEDEPF